jgi:DNA modification methylase
MIPHLEYYWIAMLKHAGTNKAVHSRSVQCGMKPILIFNKAPRTKPKRYFNDVIIGTGKEKDAHEWQQGEEELRQIFEPFTDPGDTVLDPFMGSGTTIAMAKKLNRLAIGFDIDEQNVMIVKGRVIDNAL